MTGDVSVRVQSPKMPHLVPNSFDQRLCSGPAAGDRFILALLTLFAVNCVAATPSSGNDFDTLDTLGHLRWMMQK